MAIVHVVLAGEYEDEHIAGVWATAEEAVQYVACEQAKPRNECNEQMIIEAWPVGGGGERINWRYFEHPDLIAAAQEHRQREAQRLYDAKRQRYGSPADGTQWLENMANRFKSNRHRRNTP